MHDYYDRREILKRAGAALLGTVATLARADDKGPAAGKGIVVGQPEGEKAGADVLASGGNAVDAIVSAALVAGVVSISNCGIGGYGGHMVIALPGKKPTAIDFNTAAPAAARPDMFPLDEGGQVKGLIHRHGWLASGVPGILAGMGLALERYGTRPFATIVQPAIRFARDGFAIPVAALAAIRSGRAQLLKDPASARLLLVKGEPPQPGSIIRNPDLAALLEKLAERKSVDSFYRGDIAQQIAAAFKKNGGLVTAADLAAYHAHEVEPHEFTWRGYSIRTAPLTAGGLSMLEALSIMKALAWDKRPPQNPETTRVRLEALRIAWDDRLKLLGDPDKTDVPVQRLLSADYARSMADRVEAALRDGKPVAAESDGRTVDGTIHLSAVDAHGGMAALTLTHGNSFGAMVTVDGLGLTLGHGMCRFDPRPGRANSAAAGKRPLDNMCPTVVLRDGRPVLAVGARGGRRIVNSVFEVLTQFVGRNRSMEEAVAAPRLHTEGDTALTVEAKWPEAEVEHLKKIGYSVKTGPGATVSAVAFDSTAGAGRGVTR